MTVQQQQRSSSGRHRPISRRAMAKNWTTLVTATSTLIYIIVVVVLVVKPPDYHGNRHRDLSHSNGGALPRDFSEYSCEDLNDLLSSTPDNEESKMKHFSSSATAKCDFARTCNDGEGIFAPVVYCHPTLSTRTLMILLGAPLALFLAVLFRVLGSTAEEFFSPGLETFSLELGLPERFAGVTLLALGNGAPDVASTVNAITNDRKRGYLMALGELTGAAMVASTLIVGVVVRVATTGAGGVTCRGETVRDVVVFILTMAWVYKSFEDGTITVREIKSFVGIYVGYAVVVLLSDLYHRRVVGPRIRRARLRRGPSADEIEVEQQPPSAVTEATALVGGNVKLAETRAVVSAGAPPTSDDAPPVRKIERMIEAISNYDAYSNDELSVASQDEENEEGAELAGQPQSFNSDLTSSSNRRTGWAMRDSNGIEPLVVFHPHHGGLVNLKHGRVGDAPDGWREAFVTGWNELVACCGRLWGESYKNVDRGAIEKFLITCEMPITVLRMLTIPVPCDGYYCRPLVAMSIALSPFWIWCYLLVQFDTNLMALPALAIVPIFLVPVISGLLILRFAPCGEVPMRVSIQVPITLVGFAVSATFLDLISDLLVDCLSFFGVVLHIPATMMGLTVLAWGNSSQDLVANMAVAKKGLSTMAITASFAGPVFNILIGLGIGLTVLTSTSNKPFEPVPVTLNNPLRVGFIFAIINGIIVIVAGVCVGKGTFPKNFGFFSMALYIAYVVASITL